MDPQEFEHWRIEFLTQYVLGYVERGYNPEHAVENALMAWSRIAPTIDPQFLAGASDQHHSATCN